MISAVAFFILGSGVSGGAINSAMMIAGRAIQGIGGGGINVMIDMIVSDMLPLRERGTFMGMIFAVFSIGTSLGPFIGGALVQHSSWRWVVSIQTILVPRYIRSTHPATVLSESPYRWHCSRLFVLLLACQLPKRALAAEGQKNRLHWQYTSHDIHSLDSVGSDLGWYELFLVKLANNHLFGPWIYWHDHISHLRGQPVVRRAHDASSHLWQPDLLFRSDYFVYPQYADLLGRLLRAGVFPIGQVIQLDSRRCTVPAQRDSGRADCHGRWYHTHEVGPIPTYTCCWYGSDLIGTRPVHTF